MSSQLAHRHHSPVTAGSTLVSMGEKTGAGQVEGFSLEDMARLSQTAALEGRRRESSYGKDALLFSETEQAKCLVSLEGSESPRKQMKRLLFPTCPT